MNATPPTIPAGCEDFAQAAASLAEAHGINRFEMTMRPDYREDDIDRNRVSGEIKVSFWRTDGRGRPSRNIRVSYEACVEIAPEYTPESVSCTIKLTRAMNRQPKSTSNVVRRCVQRLVRRLPILAFDAETESVAGCYCCQTAEEQAALRYGPNWRRQYRDAREKERTRRWPVLSRLFPQNAEMCRGRAVSGDVSTN